MIEHVTDYATRGPAKLIERYRKPKISALLASWLSELQAAENALWQLYVERVVAVATGHALDVLGTIVGQPREGRVDDVYRVWIGARILVSRSSGKVKELIPIVKKLLDGVRVKHEEYYPASFMLRVLTRIDPVTGDQIAKLLRLAKAAGVQMQFVWTGSDDTFTFAPGSVSVFDSDRGFGAGAFAAASDGTGTITFFGSVPGDALLDDSSGDPFTDDDDVFFTYG